MRGSAVAPWTISESLTWSTRARTRFSIQGGTSGRGVGSMSKGLVPGWKRMSMIQSLACRHLTPVIFMKTSEDFMDRMAASLSDSYSPFLCLMLARIWRSMGILACLASSQHLRI